MLRAYGLLREALGLRVWGLRLVLGADEVWCQCETGLGRLASRIGG